MRVFFLSFLIVLTASAAYANDTTTQSLWDRIVAWFEPATIESPAEVDQTALAQLIPPAPMGMDAPSTGTSFAETTPAMPRNNAFADPLMSPEDLSAISPAAGPDSLDMRDLSKGFEDPAPAIQQ